MATVLLANRDPLSPSPHYKLSMAQRNEVRNIVADNGGPGGFLDRMKLVLESSIGQAIANSPSASSDFDVKRLMEHGNGAVFEPQSNLYRQTIWQDDPMLRGKSPEDASVLLKEKVDKMTRQMSVNFPGNPIGAFFSRMDDAETRQRLANEAAMKMERDGVAAEFGKNRTLRLSTAA